MQALALTKIDYGLIILAVVMLLAVLAHKQWKSETPAASRAQALGVDKLIEQVKSDLGRKGAWLEYDRWAIEHRADLMEDWNLCQSKQTPRTIPPLE